jgi:hypothetical protein
MNLLDIVPLSKEIKLEIEKLNFGLHQGVEFRQNWLNYWADPKFYGKQSITQPVATTIKVLQTLIVYNHPEGDNFEGSLTSVQTLSLRLPEIKQRNLYYTINRLSKSEWVCPHCNGYLTSLISIKKVNVSYFSVDFENLAFALSHYAENFKSPVAIKEEMVKQVMASEQKYWI